MIYLYLLFTVIEITGDILESEFLVWLFKPLLMPVLFLWVFKEMRKNNLKKWVLLSVVFSWGGDFLLLFVPQNENFFLFGLASFLLAQLLYTWLFSKLSQNDEISSKQLFLIGGVVFLFYYFILMAALWANLKDFTIPVLVYGAVICVMGLSALRFFLTKGSKGSIYTLAGALTFVVSDSIIAINKFIYDDELYKAQAIIMLTYCIAQFLIMKGLLIEIENREARN